jgi:ATP-binding cassette, subfamily C, bacterial CydD
MAIEHPPEPSSVGKQRLAQAVKPGRRLLSAAGCLQCLAIAATAIGFYALAAIVQDVLEPRGSSSRELSWLLVLAASAVLRAGAGYAAARLAMSGALQVEARLRSALLARLLCGSGSSLPAGAQATAVIDEVERVGGYAERYVPARIAAMLVPVVLLVAVFWQNWFVGVLLVLCGPLPPLNLSVVGMGTADVARRHAEELRHLSGYFLDRLKGLDTLRALGAERDELARVRVASKRLAESSMAVLRVAFVSAAVLEGIVTVSMAIVAIYIGLTLLGYVDVTGLPAHMSLQTGLFLLMVTPLYFQPVRALASAYHERADALAAVDALAPLLAQGQPADLVAKRQLLTQAPAITIADLSVRFAGRELPALWNVSLTIRPGELVGLTGVSGAGKSTLLRVIAGQLEPSDGIALVGEVPSRELAPNAVTWLGQHPYLFAGTIADNIALDRSSVSADQIASAARAAGLGSVLGRLPDGIDTLVGEGGFGLSGGEAHRIALARTFLKRAPLIVLDEPTAHLDAGSEATMIEAIVAVAQTGTTIIASHSPAVLAACDRVITLDRGELVTPADRLVLAEALG